MSWVDFFSSSAGAPAALRACCREAVGSTPILRASLADSWGGVVDRGLMDMAGVSAGVMFMFFDIYKVNPEDDAGVKLGKMYGTMVTGMAAGMLGYKITKVGGQKMLEVFWSSEEAEENQTRDSLIEYEAPSAAMNV